jgi:hypothetical protein
MFGYFERQMLKSVEGGYIFQPPPPTRFRRTEAVIVNEAKKEEILRVIRRGQKFWLHLAALAAAALAVASVTFMELHGAPFPVAIVLGFSVWLIAQMVGMVLVLDLNCANSSPSSPVSRIRMKGCFPYSTAKGSCSRRHHHATVQFSVPCLPSCLANGSTSIRRSRTCSPPYS